MEKIRICFISPSANTYSETFIKNLKLGLEGKVFHCYGDIFPFLTLDGKLQNFKTPPMKDLIFQRLGLIRQPLREHYLSRFLKENRIDLIFANYGPSGAELAPVAKAFGIPMVVHFHGFDASIYSVLDKYKEGYRQLFEVASKIIVVSEEMKGDLLRLGAPEEKLVKITYAPHARFLDLKPKHQDSQLLAIGRFVEKKAPYLTLMAYKLAKEKCSNLRLKMVGDGELLSVCKDICRSLNIYDVEFLGVQSPAEIADLMESSFCFVQHSKQAVNGDKEGTPVAILEAMASGLPVISTRHGGIPDVVSHGVNGYLVEEGDVVKMADRIVELYHNRAKAQEFGFKGKDLIQRDFRQVDYFIKVNELINSVVSNG